MITRSVVTDDGAVEALDRVAVRAPEAISRGLDEVSLLAGTMIERNAASRLGSSGGADSLASGFLPAVGAGPYTRLLGVNARWYWSVHEYGAQIVARRAPYLTFPLPDGSWAKVRSVTVPEQRYVRDALDELDATGEAALIMGLELGRLFSRKL